MKLLLGVADFGEQEEKMLCREAAENGIEISACERRYSKAGIMQYLSDHPDTDVVVLSEAVEAKSPFDANDYELLAERHENVRVILILMDERRGTEYMKNVFYSGIYNAVFASDAEMNMVLRLMNVSRSRKEAKLYYKLADVDDTDTGANIARCVQNLTSAASMIELTERAMHILNMLDEEEFREVLSRLGKDRLDDLRAIPAVAPYIPSTVVEGKVSAQRGSIISSIAGALTAAPCSSPPETPKESNIRQPDPVKSGLHMNALSVDDLFEIISNVIVGFVGNQRRSGVTHQAITAAHFLAAHGYHVALADCSARGGKSLSAFETIERYRDTTILTAESFSYLGVDYYKNMTSESLNKIFSAAEKYHFVIIDYGTFSPYVKSDIGRCSIKCGVCGSMPWEVNQLRAFADDTRFLSDQMTYLIRGVSPDARTQQTWISDLVDHYLFADIQEDPFDGSCYPALAGLFEKYVKGLPAKTPSEKKEKNMGVVTRTAEMGVVADGLREHEVPKTRLFRRHTKSKPAEERTTEKEPSLSPRINMRKPVSGCWFVASLKHGVGCSYVSAVIANFLAMQNDKVGLITGDEDLREYVSNNVHMYAWGDGADAAFAACTVVVIDGGVCTSLTADQKKELARSSHKYMVCRSGDDYMRVLADFVSTDEWASDKWAYIFNQIPPSDHGKINRLMANYDICYLPSCDARHPAKDVKRSVLSIMR